MKKILIIEDDLNVVALLRSRLEEYFEVEVAPDGQSGYYSISERKPNAVLLDLTIQEMDPLSLFGKIRAQKKFCELPFFILVDSLPNDLADEALTSGANGVFSKSELDYVDSILGALKSHFESRVHRYYQKSSPTPTVPSQPSSPPPRARPAESQPAKETAPRVAAETPPGPGDENLELREELRDLFAAEFNSKVHTARQALVVNMTAKDPALRAMCFEKFYKAIASLRAEAAQCELDGLLRLLNPLEARARQLRENIESIAPASRQVLANAVDLLASMNTQVSEIAALNRMSPCALVVDDESVSRKAMSLGLEKARISVTPAESGEAALVEAEHSRFDLMILDVEMPGMNGFALCARIRAIPQHRTTPIIFISALDDLRTRASTKISGGNQFIAKPVNFLELSVTTNALLLKTRLKEIDKAVLSNFASFQVETDPFSKIR